MSEQNTLSFYGEDFEIKVLKALIGTNEKKGDRYKRNARFGSRMIQKMKSSHFKNQYAQAFFIHTKNYFIKYNTIPYYDSLKSYYFTKESNLVKREIFESYLNEVKNTNDDDQEFVKENTIGYVNTLNLQQSLNHILSEYVNKGKHELYGEALDNLMSQIIEVKEPTELNAFTPNDDSDMDEAARLAIPTGILRLDKIMNGGLAGGELALVIAALKVGKTTFGTYVANNAALEGFNVLQVVYEDTDSQIKAKHRAKFAGVEINTVRNKRNKKSILRKSNSKLKKIYENGGSLTIVTLPASETTVDDLESLIIRARDKGIYRADLGKYVKVNFDLLLIDYVDCINAKGNYNEEWKGEKEVLRAIENLAKEYALAIWAFTQGGRSSLNSKMVDVADMGGNLKKAQIAHFLMSIAKTLEQRQENLGTCAILGSRIGADGIVFKDCYFNNATVDINFGEESSLKEFLEDAQFAEN